jgi:hypothetical protein
MAYEYKKLSEVEAIDVADSSVNLIVETEDEIKKMNIGDLPIGQEQADWEEKDETKASFIKNKPDLSQVGGSGKITIINTNAPYIGSAPVSAMTFADTGELVTMKKIHEALLSGQVFFKEEIPASLDMAPSQSYYSVSYFNHSEEYTYTSDTGYTQTKPETIVVVIDAGGSSSYRYTFD